MNRNLARLLILVPWASVPAAVVGFLALRGRMPERLAVHFDASGAADRWMSLWQFVALVVVLLVFLLANFTWKLLGGREPDKFVVRLLYYYVGTIIVLAVFFGVLCYNL